MERSVMVFQLLFLLFSIPACSGFEWTSSSQLADGSSFRACVGEIAKFPWDFSLAADDRVVNVEWYRTNENGEDLLAVLVADHFLTIRNVTHLPKAGLQVQITSLADFGNYSVKANYITNGFSFSSQQSALLSLEDAPVLENGQLTVRLLPQPLQDDVTGQMRVLLACGTFLSLGSRPVSVVWKTPTEEVIESSDYANGSFLLNLPQSAQGGGYHCYLKDPARAARCAPSMSRLQRGAYLRVDEVQVRLILLEGQVHGLEAKDDNLHEQLKAQTAKLDRHGQVDVQHEAQQKNLTAEVGGLSETTALLADRIDKLASVCERLVVDNRQLEEQTTQLASDNQQLKDQTTQMASDIQKLQAGFDPARKRIGFHAEIRQKDLVKDEILTSTKIFTNKGEAFNGSSGIFTAPVDGIYLFIVTIATSMNSNQKQNCNLFLVIEGVHKAIASSSYHEDNYVTGSTHLLHHMTAGQKAWLQNNVANSQFWDDPSSFTGVLLYPDLPE